MQPHVRAAWHGSRRVVEGPPRTARWAVGNGRAGGCTHVARTLVEGIEEAMDDGHELALIDEVDGAIEQALCHVFVRVE